MILRPTLQFVAADGRLASIPVQRFDTIEAGEVAIGAAIVLALAEGGTCLALRIEGAPGRVDIYRWSDDTPQKQEPPHGKSHNAAG